METGHIKPSAGMLYRSVSEGMAVRLIDVDGDLWTAAFIPIADREDPSWEYPCVDAILEERLANLGYLPDLTDPATQALLPVIARKAWNDPKAHASPAVIGGWYVHRTGRVGDSIGMGAPGSHPKWMLVASGGTESEAWIAAILSAPRKDKP